MVLHNANAFADIKPRFIWSFQKERYMTFNSGCLKTEQSLLMKQVVDLISFESNLVPLE